MNAKDGVFLRPRMRSIYAWVAPGGDAVALALRIEPPRESAVPLLQDFNGFGLKELRQSGDSLVLSQPYSRTIQIGPVYPPRAVGAKSLVDGPNLNISPIGEWTVAATRLSGPVSKSFTAIITLVFADFVARIGA
jgi:hypothetical protein